MIRKGNKLTNIAREIYKRPDLLDFIKSNRPLKEIFSLPSDLNKDRIDLYKKAYFGICNTDYYKVNLPNENKLFIKMEYANSMGNTHYSRYWIINLFIGEILGVFYPNQTKIIEVTSGSSGIALSIACSLLNYDVTILVPAILPENRIAPMRCKTTNIIKVNGYINDCIFELRNMVQQNEYFPTNHSEEKADLITHIFSRIGYEIINDSIEPDYAILAMGNGTSTIGIAKPLKEKLPKTKIISYRPHFENNPNDIVFGLIGANIDCRHVAIAMNYVDEMKFTSGIDLKLIKSQYKYDTEISNMGLSSLYGIHFAHELANEVHSKNILTIGYDKQDRY
jgi:cysteine synthase